MASATWPRAGDLVADSVVAALRHEFLERYPTEAAHVLEAIPEDELVDLVEHDAQAATLVGRLAPDVASRVIAQNSNATIRRALGALDPARAAALVARLEGVARQRVLAAVDRDLAREIRELMAYPPDSAGALMDPRVSAFHIGTTVDQAVAVLRTKRPPELGSVYVIDKQDQLVGAVALGELATAGGTERLDDLAKFPASTNAFATREEIVDFLGQQRLASLPVVDIHGRLIGVIRNQTLIAATEQEASADMQTSFGVSKDERALSRVPFAVRQRLPWLQINLATAFFAAFIVGIFQDTIARVTALAVLMPVVAGESGNSGMQAVAVTLRGLALREVNLRHWPRLVVKEIGVGVLNGMAVAAVTGLGVYFWSRSVPLALVISGSMLISLVVAGVSGTSIPMILKSLGQDPAQASSIFLTTVTCGIGLLSFLGLATIFIGLLTTASP